MTERAVLCTDGCYYWTEWEPVSESDDEPEGWWDSLPEQEDE
jgi:hypothetical protein